MLTRRRYRKKCVRGAFVGLETASLRALGVFRGYMYCTKGSSHQRSWHFTLTTASIEAKGKIRKTSPLKILQTQLGNLVSPSLETFLLQVVTIEQPQLQAKALSDLDAANNLNMARLKLLDLFNRRSKSAA